MVDQKSTMYTLVRKRVHAFPKVSPCNFFSFSKHGHKRCLSHARRLRSVCSPVVGWTLVVIESGPWTRPWFQHHIYQNNTCEQTPQDRSPEPRGKKAFEVRGKNTIYTTQLFVPSGAKFDRFNGNGREILQTSSKSNALHSTTHVFFNTRFLFSDLMQSYRGISS